METIVTDKKKRTLGIPTEVWAIGLLSLFIMAPLLTAHWIRMGESIDQVLRVIETARGLEEGSFYPRWFGDMAGGFGNPYFVFYAPLIYFVSALFHLAGFGVIASLKCMMILGILLAGIGMFFFSRFFMGAHGALVSAMAYIYLPYRVVNLYVRGDLAEAFAMSLVPWVFYFLYTTIMEKRQLQVTGLALSYGALIFTHNCTALTVSALIAFFLLFATLSEKNYRGLLHGIIGLALGLGISAVFWLPALWEKNLVYIERIYNNAAFDFHNNFIEPFRLFSPLWSLDAGIGGRELPLQVGIPHLILAFLTIPLLWKNHAQVSSWGRRTLLFFLLAFLLTAFLTLRASTPIWENIVLMQYIQFPWRLLALMGFCISFLAGGLFCFMRSASMTSRQILQVGAVILIVWSGAQHCYVRGYYILNEETLDSTFVRKEWSTASSYNTKEMKHIKDFGEYLPKTVKAVPERNRAGRIIVADGEAKISGQTTGIDTYSFEAMIEKEAEIVVGSFYYPSWKATSNGQMISLFTDEEGLIHLTLPKGRHRLNLWFGGSFPRNVATGLSLATALILLATGVLRMVHSFSSRGTRRSRGPGDIP